MKKSAIIICLFILSIGQPLNAQDGAFSDARTLNNQQISLSAETAIYTDLNNEVMLLLRGGYGLQPGLSFHGKVGIFLKEAYIGGHLKYLLADESRNAVSFSIIGGAYSFGDIGLKLGGIVSKDAGALSLYTGLLYEPLFENPVRNAFMIPLGVDIPLSDRASFIFEADLALTSDGQPYQALHTGFNFYF